MIDALLYAIRDGIRAANIGYGNAECEIMDGAEPPPRCGNFFVSVHDGATRSDADNQLMEYYDFSITLTMRVVVPLDRLGDQQIARNVTRDIARRQGFYARCDQLRALIHMNWGWVVQTDQTPNSANDNLVSWADGDEVYGFCEPMRFQSMEFPKVVGGEWFAAEPDSEDVGVKSTLRFGKARRMQPQTQSNGPFV